MSKVVFMFPGQGAQYIGMGKDFYDACEESKAVYELASKVTGLDIAKLCFEENEEINITEYTQIAMLTTEAAIYAALKETGAKRVVPLKVSGPFHSAMLTGAGEKLAEVLENTKLQEFSIPYVTNVTADYVTTTEPVKELLKKQVSSSVRWQQSIERLIADGYDEFVEIGPGHTLSGFMRKINRDVKTVSIEKLEDYKAYVGE